MLFRSLAVCNDGTDAIVYYRPGIGAQADRAILYFQGGAWCSSEGDCAGRYNHSRFLMSTGGDALNTTMNGGIMSNNCTYNPDFCNASVIFFRYCSSDSFAGDAPNPVFGGWQMRGKRHVAAVLDGMTGVAPNLFNPPLQASSLSTVLVIGDSAGGVATLSNVDFVAQSYFIQMHQVRF